MKKLVLLCFSIFFSAGCGQVSLPASTKEQPQVPQVGRYVIVHSPHIERDTVLLDTATGKTWEQVQFTDLEDDPVGWVPMGRTDNDDEMTEVRLAHPAKEQNQKH